VKRRTFIAGLGSAVAWPLAARAQQPTKPVIALVNGGSADTSAGFVSAFRKGLGEAGVGEGRDASVEYNWLDGQYDRLPTLMADLVRRRVAVIAAPGNPLAAIAATAYNEADDSGRLYIAAFRDALAKLGWVEGRNLQVVLRYGGGDVNRTRTYAAQLVGLDPDAIVTGGGMSTRILQEQTPTIPIVITGAGDPGATGFSANIARPEGNVTGITNLYASLGGKWLELLKEAAPGVERVGIVYNPQVVPVSNYASSIEEAARVLSVRITKIPFRDSLDIVCGIDAFASEPNGGLIIAPPSPTSANRETILRLAAQHRLPTIHATTFEAVEGGLIAYGSNVADRWRRAASFVDRILRGAKVSELPIEFPTKFELAINLKTAKALGLTVPQSILLRADEVIE
jgi:putative ABC transport system substrate-binding protein